MVPDATVIGTTMAPADSNMGVGLIECLDAAIEKGWFNAASVKALRTATLKVREVESGWESTDLRSRDGNSLFDRFRNLRSNAYSDDLITVGGVSYVLTCSRRRPSSGRINKRG
jgi:hypothetical protein